MATPLTLDQATPLHILAVSGLSLALYAPLAGALARRGGGKAAEAELAALGSYPGVVGTLKRTYASGGLRAVYRGTSVLAVRFAQVLFVTLAAAHATRPAHATSDTETNHYLLAVALALGLSVLATYPLFALHVAAVLAPAGVSTLDAVKGTPRRVATGGAALGAGVLQALTALCWSVHPVFWLAWPRVRPTGVMVAIFVAVASGLTALSLKYQGEAAGVVAAQLEAAERTGAGEAGAPLTAEV
ncbi:hypothetical protein Q8F55_000094 [Vanrija albida]|uniref:Uncharacterized protein n=1 Tax=Vanrija albida TaxID=181172 RepID=A0ABR3QCA2_9TREE